MYKLAMSAVVLSSIMIGCGGGGSSKVGVGYYVDSAVEGVSYVCGTQRGETDAQGKFSFEIGEGCSFLVNNQEFKTVDASILHDGVTIQERDPKIARFLLSLDDDGVDDKIKILPEVAKVVNKIPQSEDDFVTLGRRLANVQGYNGHVVTEKVAEDHLSDSIGIMKANATVSPTQPKQDEMVTLSAAGSTISKGDIAAYEWIENGKRISTKESFSKKFTLGEHTVTLVIRDSSGSQAKDTVHFTVIPAKAPTKWDNITPLATNGTSELYVTSDANNLYLLLKKEHNITDAQFFLNTDNSNISGLKSRGEGFDYVVKSDGIYHILHANDYTGPKVQDISYSEVNNTLEIAIDKANIEYLAEKIPVFVFFPKDATQSLPSSGAVKKFTDSFYDKDQKDTIPPVITAPTMLTVDGNYTKPSASAYDVFDHANVTVSSDDTAVKPAIPGYYTITHTAEDISGNKATAYTTVHVLGESSTKTLEVKTLSGDDVVINAEKGLVWVNDHRPEATSVGCTILRNEATFKTDLEKHCSNLNTLHYAGLDTWRVPTSLELSKFTVQMLQEGKTPGMAKMGCLRILGIDDNTTVKAVGTHNMPKIQRGIVVPLGTPSGGRCVSGPRSSGDFDLSVSGVITDTKTNLTWISETDPKAKKCLAIHKVSKDINATESQREYNLSKGFCAGIGFRDPTPVELQDFIVRTTNEAHILPGYLAPCQLLLAREANGSEYAVSTRFNTKQSLGTITPLVVPLTSNIGLRCVK